MLKPPELKSKMKNQSKAGSNGLPQYRLSQRLVASQVGEETVILDYSGGKYFGLEGVGSFIWEFLERGPASAEHICEAVVGAYEVSPEVCARDVQVLLEDLKRQGLIEIIKD